MELPGTTRLIAVATNDFPRHSEGDLIPLADPRHLLLAYGRKSGSSDFAPGELVALTSRDAGISWDDHPRTLLNRFDDTTDLMSVSLLRTTRGLHLFFLARGPNPRADCRIYQLLSTDNARTWSPTRRVSTRPGYHIVNNARVVLTESGRIIVPCAYVPGDIGKLYNTQRIFCCYSDDLGDTWRESNDLTATKPGTTDPTPLMEPGVAPCPDGSLYMTIRTQLGALYESRSVDNGTTWDPPRPTTLAAPAAPPTVMRDPASDTLWLIYCDRPKANWKGRSRYVLSTSTDSGHTWSPGRPVAEDPKHSYGYFSLTPVGPDVITTYYDWTDAGQRGFQLTSLRQRTIPLAWFRAEPVPPVFHRTTPTPVLAPTEGEGRILSCNSGLLADTDRWRLWYTNGVLGPDGEKLAVKLAESHDRGLTWTKHPDPTLPEADGYHPSVHRTGDKDVTLYCWRRNDTTNGLWRYVSQDDGTTFTPDPAHPLVASHNAPPPVKASAGDGRISNDAFDLVRTGKSWTYLAARVEKATDPRAVIKHDNAPGLVRMIARATSTDSIHFSPTEFVIRPDHGAADPHDLQFYGIQVIHYRRFYLGLLHVFHADSQVIQPEWAWSHDAINWVRTRTPAIALGDEGAFDSRMILFGALTLSNDELVWLYSGYDWRHNAFRKGHVTSAIGRASLKLTDLDQWLNTLPEP